MIQAAMFTSQDAPDLSSLDVKDAVEVLKARATVLDVSNLSPQWQAILDTCVPGIVPGITVPGKLGLEEIVVCDCTWKSNKPIRDVFTMSEFDWLVVEVNTLHRRVEAQLSGVGKRMRIPFFCKFCNEDMVDKADLGWHRQQDLCLVHDAVKEGRLKIYPVNGSDGNKEARAVFKKYKMKLPFQMMDRRRGPHQVKKLVIRDSKDKDFQKESIQLSSDDGQSTEEDDFVDVPAKKKTKVGTMITARDLLKGEYRSKEATRTRKVGKMTGPGQCSDASGLAPKPSSTPSIGTPSLTGTPTRSLGSTSTGIPPVPDPMHTRHKVTFLLPSDTADLRRKDVERDAWERAMVDIPDLDKSKPLSKPSKPPGLYTLVEQSGDIIPLELLVDLVQPGEALKDLQEKNLLAKKVFAAWGTLSCQPDVKDTLPKSAVDAVDRCKAVFMEKKKDFIQKEIDCFILYHGKMFTYSQDMQEFTEAVRSVDMKRRAFVEVKMRQFDLQLLTAAEDKLWSWSPLFKAMASEPVPPFLARPFEHSSKEFQSLLQWLTEEGKRIGILKEAPAFARALKLFSRSECGGRMPMVCPVKGLTQKTLVDRATQILYAMEELIRCGSLYFPTMDRSGQDFDDLVGVLQTGKNREALLRSYMDWARQTFIRGCLDMVALKKEAELQVMWVASAGEDRDVVCSSFRHVLLLRENIDLGYSLGSVEATGVWPKQKEELFQAAKSMREASLIICHKELSAWTVMEDLHDLEDFRASQIVRTIADVLQEDRLE